MIFVQPATIHTPCERYITSLKDQNPESLSNLELIDVHHKIYRCKDKVDGLTYNIAYMGEISLVNTTLLVRALEYLQSLGLKDDFLNQELKK